jgi:hypothetical protein
MTYLTGRPSPSGQTSAIFSESAQRVGREVSRWARLTSFLGRVGDWIRTWIHRICVQSRDLSSPRSVEKCQ